MVQFGDAGSTSRLTGMVPSLVGTMPVPTHLSVWSLYQIGPWSSTCEGKKEEEEDGEERKREGGRGRALW